jgi:hypothetical protein
MMNGFETGPATPADPLQSPVPQEPKPEGVKKYFKIAKVAGIVFAVIVLAVLVFS